MTTILRNLWLMPHEQRVHYLSKSVRWFYRKRRLGHDREYADKLAQENPHMRMFNVLRPNYQAAERYQPKPYVGEMVLLRALIQSPRSAHSQTLGWDALVDRDHIKVCTVPGEHLTMMEEPHVGQLMTVLNRELDQVVITLQSRVSQSAGAVGQQFRATLMASAIANYLRRRGFQSEPHQPQPDGAVAADSANVHKVTPL